MGQADHRSERPRRQAEQALTGYSELPSWKRQTLARFLVESRHGWHTYFHRALPHTPFDEADVLLVGPKGVFVVLLRDEPPPGADTALAFRRASDLFVGARGPAGNVTEAVVRPVVVLPHAASQFKRSTVDHLVVSVGDLDRFLRRGENRLDRRGVRALAAHLGGTSAGYEARTLQDDRAEPDASEELFSTADARQDRFDQALSGSFESWLTFLDDSQFAMVRRHYSGPARISGPAGTGKSVVALHRLVHLAKRTTNPLLFTTYARNLPPILQRSFQRLAPELGERVEFRTLHSWARRFLEQRGIHLDVDHGQVRTSFAMAWSRFGRRTKLAELNPNWTYWWDEIDRVIKGRGLSDVTEYQAVQRTGRGMRLERGDDRMLMWQLFEKYEEIRQDKGQHDFNDLLARALEEVHRAPLEHPYAAVVVDEVQDITLIGLRVLHAIAGDGPNGLLLVGDGQQQIYAGGWRLSDAGIPIRGRGEVLRNNYRNAARILDLAAKFDATNQVDDLDGDVGVSLREAVPVLRGGHAVPWRGPRHDHESALLAALGALGDLPRDDIAVLTFGRNEATHWRRVLRDAGVPVFDLDEFEGHRDGKVKVGTVFRAKGLEFRAVLVPELPARRAGDERDREWQERGQRAQLVVLTRARDHLWLGFPQG